MSSVPHPQHTALSVNLNKVALVRNTRHLGIPSVTRAATLCLQAGARGITVHPRPDERHIRRHDVFDLAELMLSWPDREFNIEGNPFHNLMAIAADVRSRGLPLHQLTFVPDSEGQFTSDHGWRFPDDAQRLAPLVAQAQALGARVSLFMDADASAMPGAKAVGADRVELYTEPYAAAWGTPEQAAQLARFRAAATSRAGCRAGRERWPRPQPRQPHRVSAHGARGQRGLDRSRADRRCAGAGLCGHRGRVQPLHRRSVRLKAGMIYGIGTDVCDIRRIETTFQRQGERFVHKVLGEAELLVWQQRSERWPQRGLRYLATRFSAKEAFSKAIGMGMRMPMSWRRCEILNEPSGRPVIVLHGELKRWFDAQGLSAQVSVTDETDYAASFVVVERLGVERPTHPAEPRTP